MIRTLALKQYRNYAHLELEFPQGLSVVAGPNAQGKTNLLEAIYLIATGRVWRGSRETEAIHAGAEQAMVEAELAPSGTHLRVMLSHGSRKRVMLNSVALPRASDVLGRLPTVLFSNEDLEMVREDASARRRFMDEELAQLSTKYFHNLAGYKRSLEQRNAMLKRQQKEYVDRESIRVWETHLSQFGANLRVLRQEFIKDLASKATHNHFEFSSGESLRIEYHPKEPCFDSEALMDAYEERYVLDCQRGTTSVGPHRDDFLIEIDGRDARTYGSQGQQRTAAIALKLAVAHLLQDSLEKPVILLDDVLSELDESRRTRLLSWARASSSQTILTCNEVSQVGDELAAAASVFEVRKGTVTLR